MLVLIVNFENLDLKDTVKKVLEYNHYTVFDYSKKIDELTDKILNARDIFEYKEIYDLVVKHSDGVDDANKKFTDIMGAKKKCIENNVDIREFYRWYIDGNFKLFGDDDFATMGDESKIAYIDVQDVHTVSRMNCCAHSVFKIKIMELKSERGFYVYDQNNWRHDYSLYDYVVFNNDDKVVKRLNDGIKYLEQEYKIGR